MFKQTRTEKVALALSLDLTVEGLKRYITENERLVENERHMGRSPRKYQFYVNAGKLALEYKGEYE